MSEERLREELVSFARLILLLNRKGALLDRSASLLRLLGDLRRTVFAWEVRVTDREGPPRPRRPGQPEPLPPDDASARIVREALERERELLRELERETLDDDPDGDDL
jgi:hypothetical protein